MFTNITKFEKVRIISERATQISKGAPVSIDINGLTDTIEIATKEYNENKIPLIIQRKFPNNNIKEIKIFKK
tara:strand:- start:1152 stop:1367 length:216 start_codon:yes stop_codon:yes gene_type:complete